MNEWDDHALILYDAPFLITEYNPTSLIPVSNIGLFRTRLGSNPIMLI
jgi:hypothetical protein